MDDDAALLAALNGLVAASTEVSESLGVLVAAQGSGGHARVAALVTFEDARTGLLRAARGLAPLLGAAGGGAAGPGGVRGWPQSADLRGAVTAAGKLLGDEALGARRSGIRAVARELGQCQTVEEEGVVLEALRGPGERERVFDAVVAFSKAARAHLDREQLSVYREAAAGAGVSLTITESIVGSDGTSVEWDVTDPDPAES